MRDYELVLTLNTDEVVRIIPELRVQFDITKSVKGGLNSCRIKIYNLSADKRKKLIKDKTDNSIKMPFLFRAGYEKIETIFKGTILEASSVREGVDFVTTINCLDGGYDFINSYTSKTVTNNNIDNLLTDSPNIEKGKITELKQLFRPRVFVGKTFKLISDMLAEDETYFIDNEKLHIIKDDEVIDDYIPLIQPSTGLLNTPVRKNKEVSFSTLMNPVVKIGGLVELKSTTAEHLNGVYKVITIRYSGDNYGKDWLQECICQSSKEYKVLK